MRLQQHARDELQFVTELTTLFDVLQQTAVSQLRRADARASQQPSLQRWLREDLFPALPDSARRQPWVRGGARGRLLVVLTSDEGLSGPLHAAVIREALARADDATEWWLIGSRGRRLLGERLSPTQLMPVPPDDQAEVGMRRIADAILARYAQAAYREAWLVASRFVSAVHQEPIAYPLLPLPLGTPVDHATDRELIIEPSVLRLVQQLASLWVEVSCVEAFWSARRAEFAARTIHMEVSRQALSKRLRLIRYELFKALHERVDVLVRESCVIQRHAVRHTQAARVASQVLP